MGGGVVGREGEEEPGAGGALLLLPLLTKRRGDVGLLRLRVCGFWGLVVQYGRVRCRTAQHSAVQEIRSGLGSLAGPEIELMQRSQVMLFMGWHGRLKAGRNEPQKRAPVEDPDGRVESRW